jgi:hypothetical protein
VKRWSGMPAASKPPKRREESMPLTPPPLPPLRERERA